MTEQMDEELIKRISAIVEKSLAKPRVPIEDEAWTAEQVAEYLSVCTRQVKERYATADGFPRPRRLPSNGSKGHLRWRAGEVIEWFRSNGSKSSTGGRPRKAA